MAKKRIYTPIVVINNFENRNEGIYEMFDRVRTGGESDFNSATTVAGSFYNPQVQSNNFMICSIILFVLGAWRNDKKTVRLTKELTDKFFYPNKFKFEDTDVLAKYLSDPVYFEVEGINNIHGMFVRYVKDINAECLVVVMVDKDANPVYNVFRLNFWLSLEDQIEDFAKKFKNEKQRMTATQSMLFALQAAAYFCYHRNDIRENEEQKKVDRKPEKVQNRYSEVQIFDVGKLFTEKTRGAAQLMEKLKDEGYVVRKAHWHKMGKHLKFLPETPLKKR